MTAFNVRDSVMVIDTFTVRSKAVKMTEQYHGIPMEIVRVEINWFYWLALKILWK